MTNKEILEKAIQKAIDGGWDNPYVFRLQGWVTNAIEVEPGLWMPVIFNHDFAKSLWGGVEYCRCPVSRKRVKRNPAFYADCICHHRWAKLDWWEYQLQQMVISDDPIKYLGEHI